MLATLSRIALCSTESWMSLMAYLPVKFATALGREIVDGPDGVGGVAGVTYRLALGLQLRRQIVARRVAQQSTHPCEAPSGSVGQLPCHRFGAVTQFLGRRDLVDQPPLQRLCGVDWPIAQVGLRGTTRTDQPGQVPGSAAVSRKPQRGKGGHEFGVLCSDHQIRGG